MSANATAVTPLRAVAAPRVQDRGHRIRLITGYVLAVILILGLTIYGWDYYTLGAADRAFSPKHHELMPSGSIGLKLGYLGTFVFFLIFLYPLRKRLPWMMKIGSTKHWLDIHVLLGLSAPFIIAFHSSFKFSGIAGIAFWIMTAVSVSGIVGRYLYSQIPRRVNAAELTRKETQELQEQMGRQLASQNLLPQADLRRTLKLPSPETVARLPIAVAIVYMMILDALRVFRIARLRRHALSGSEYLTSFGGFFPSGHRDLERAIHMAREEATLSKRILFLSRTEKVFHLWHVIHKPFSYAFAMLALAHIVLAVVFFGYR